jgi:hypothetical protein
MEQESPSKLKSALNSGAVLGLILMVFTLITYVFGMYENQLFSYLSWVVMIVGIVMATKKFRDEAGGGFISYGSALGYGILVSLFASLILAFTNYIYLGFVDDSFITFTLEQAERGMYESGQSDDQIEMAMSMTRKMVSPAGIAIWGVIGMTILGLIFSLIIAAFVKREPNSFDDVQ